MNKPEKIFDGLLVLQYQNGDKKALSLLVKRWHTKLCRQAYWYTKDSAIAKDIVQDSWGVILQQIYKLKNTNSFGSWALTIVNRKAIDWIRTSKKADEKLHQFYENSKTNYDTIEDNNTLNTNNSITDINNTKIVIAAIENLPKNQQIIVKMFYTEAYTLQEISTILEISKGTVKSRLFYAREKLKSTLKNIKNEK
jgi:RNA polymerase sigma factor (sigma-70 family)